jgi:hypothetical protein
MDLQRKPRFEQFLLRTSQPQIRKHIPAPLDHAPRASPRFCLLVFHHSTATNDSPSTLEAPLLFPLVYPEPRRATGHSPLPMRFPQFIRISQHDYIHFSRQPARSVLSFFMFARRGDSFGASAPGALPPSLLNLHFSAPPRKRATRIPFFFNLLPPHCKIRSMTPPTFNLHQPTAAMLLSPLSATLTADLRVLPCFGRSCPPATPLDATLTDSAPVTPLSATLTKNVGEGATLSALAKWHVYWFALRGAR